jgi:hypothetical protein
MDAWFAATGTKQDDAGYDAFDAAMTARHPQQARFPELGNDWSHDDDAEMQRRYPRLWAMYMGDRE